MKPNDTQGWIALGVSLIYVGISAAFIKYDYFYLGWSLHALNLVRLFIQFHDMAHFSYFQTIQMNKLVGHIIGIITHFPFDMWRDGHNYHHKHFGNLDKVDLSQTILFTKKEYESWSTPKKIVMRIFREPIIFFTISVQIIWFFGVLGNCIKRYGFFSIPVLEKLLSFVLMFFLS